MFESESHLGREKIRNTLHRRRIPAKTKRKCLSQEKEKGIRIIRRDLWLYENEGIKNMCVVGRFYPSVKDMSMGQGDNGSRFLFRKYSSRKTLNIVIIINIITFIIIAISITNIITSHVVVCMMHCFTDWHSSGLQLIFFWLSIRIWLKRGTPQ